MDAAVRELLDLALRWVHVIAGIMWIGNSMLWNWIDRNLEPSKQGKPGIQGEIWLLHSGAFYFMEKDLKGWDRDRPLHWFKWQAYTTWLTGAGLLAVVYYAAAGAMLVDPAVADLAPRTAVLIGIGTIVGAWLVYHHGIARLLARSGPAAALLGLLLVVGVAYGLTHLFSGRAAFLHVGALLGTVMAGNVHRVIMPSQRLLVAAVEEGRTPDPAPAKRAKERSIHNNYITFPVIALMLVSHFPAIYGHRWNWLLLALIVVAGAGVRHVMNIRFTYPHWKPALAATVAASLVLLYVALASPAAGGTTATPAGTGPVTFAQANAVLQKRCAVCHSADPADRTFGVAPAGVAFDTPEQIHARADRILARAVTSRTMPPANKTFITDGEREILRRWIEGGAEIP